MTAGPIRWRGAIHPDRQEPRESRKRLLTEDSLPEAFIGTGFASYSKAEIAHEMQILKT